MDKQDSITTNLSNQYILSRGSEIPRFVQYSAWDVFQIHINSKKKCINKYFKSYIHFIDFPFIFSIF